MVLGVIGKKLGMTQVFDDEGLVIPVTIIKVDPLTVTQIKTVEKEGYNAIQVGTEACKDKKLNQPELGHLKSKNLSAFRSLKEFRIEDVNNYQVGQTIDLSMFNEISKVDVQGKSKGKGFAGTVKRWNAGRGPMSHGSKSHRQPGSIGAGTTPSRVYKGVKMPGRMGNEIVTVRKLSVFKIDVESSIIMIKGSVPGAEGSSVVIRPSITKWNNRSN